MKMKIAYTTGMLIILLLVGINTNLSAYNTISETNVTNEVNNMDEANAAIVQDTIIPAKDLYDAFKQDAEAATEKYGGQTISIKGYAVFVGPDVYAYPSVELSEKKGGDSRLLCVLPFSDYLKLRKVSKGDEVVMTGEVRRFYEKGDQVLLKLCVIEKVNGKIVK